MSLMKCSLCRINTIFGLVVFFLNIEADLKIKPKNGALATLATLFSNW